MSIKINTVNEESIEVNGKLIYKDHNENWVATVELTIQERNAFNLHLVALNSKEENKD